MIASIQWKPLDIDINHSLRPTYIPSTGDVTQHFAWGRVQLTAPKTPDNAKYRRSMAARLILPLLMVRLLRGAMKWYTGYHLEWKMRGPKLEPYSYILSTPVDKPFVGHRAGNRIVLQLIENDGVV